MADEAPDVPNGSEKWRALGLVVFLALLQGSVLLLVRDQSSAAAMYKEFIWGNAVLGSFICLKAAVAHAVENGGLKAAWSTPGSPAAPSPSAPQP
jgi:hypothetical protein